MKRFAAFCLLVCLLCWPNRLLAGQGSDLDSRRARFREAIEAQWQYELKTHPELATYVGDARYNDRLSDLSAQAHFALAALYRKQGKTEEAERELGEFQKLQAKGAQSDPARP